MEIYLVHFPDAESVGPMQLLVSFSSIEELKKKLARARVQALQQWEEGYDQTIGCIGPKVAIDNLTPEFFQEGKDYYLVSLNREKTTRSLLSWNK